MGERLKLFDLLIFFVYFVIFVVQLQFLGLLEITEPAYAHRQTAPTNTGCPSWKP